MMTPRRFGFGVPWSLLLTAVYLAGSSAALARPDSITVVMDDTYPPFSFKDSAGKQQGILIDQWRLWEKTTGIKVEIHAMDWGKALSAMKAGEFDVIDTIFKTEDRVEWLDFTRPYAKLEVPIFFEKDISGIADIASLKGFPVAVKAGDAAVDLLRRNGVDSLLLFNSYEAVCLAAKEQKIAVFVVDAPPALYYLHKFGIRERFKQSPPLNVGQFHRAVKKGNSELLKAVEDGFAQIPEGELRKIDTRWFGSTLQDGLMLRYFLFTAGGFALLLFILFIWNRALRQKVDVRTAELKTNVEALRKSEEKYRELVENANSIILRMDTAGTIAFFNEYASRFLGFSQDEIVGRNVVGTIVPATETKEKDLSVMLQNPERYKSAEYEITCKDGTRAWVAWTTRAIVDSQGQCVEVLCIGNDITERKLAERAVRESSELFSVFMRHSPIYTFIKSVTPLESRVLQASDNYAQMIGLPACDMIGKTMAELFPAEFAAKITADDWSVVANGEVLRIDEELNGRYYTSIKFPIIQGGKTMVAGYTIDITERKRAEIEREQFLRFFLTSGDVMVIADPNGVFLKTNPACWETFGYTEAELVSKPFIEFVHADDRQSTIDEMATQLRIGFTLNFENRYICKNGSTKWMSWRATFVKEEGITYATGRDVTERKLVEAEKARLQEQLAQSQKMESVGRLAGGVAHDFNNMLGVILGHCEMALDQAEAAHPLYAHLEEIRKAANRSADLTRQLLAFARKQTVAPKVLDLNETVTGMLKMLERLIGEDIHLDWHPGQNLWQVNVDPSQIDQILANLCVNARDAIAGVGKVTIETENRVVDDDYCAGRPGFTPGEYVQLSVSDDGYGMDTDTLLHLFEPFFTTKTMGKGTGLGLATVYGIVKQNDGFISVHSEPGRGTTLTIYLPRHIAKAAPGRIEGPAPSLQGGHETILLVEDESAILKMTTTMLELQGYSVLAANTPGEAMQLARERAGEIDLLMTDVVMPEMNGRDLAKNLLSLYPNLKRLFMSGYTADVIAHHGVLDDGVYFIQKPFSTAELAAKVREALSHG
ncbi:MAG: PAS domain S-box protein [Candidatus Hydrogenedentes bacterium]|nr:PAS domain S-box protein [Candidatus Hydrogenedentota bacterium]